jgi:transketolase
VDRTDGSHASADGVARGAYVLAEADGGTPDVIIVGTGSEVSVALDARRLLQDSGVNARVVSMPCREWYDAQEQAYRDEVFPPGIKARVSIEAGIAQGWREIVGDNGRTVSLEHYGASADAATLFREFGLTPEAVAQAARDSIATTASNGSSS